MLYLTSYKIQGRACKYKYIFILGLRYNDRAVNKVRPSPVYKAI